MATVNTFNYPMYNYAVGWFNRQAANPLDFIAPVLKAEGMLGSYKRYPQGYAFRSVDTNRSLYAAPTTISVEAEDVPFKLTNKGLRVGVDDDELGAAGADADARDMVAQAKTGTLLAAWRTSLITEGLEAFRKGVAADGSKGNWSSTSTDPVAELRDIFQAFRETNGVTPNRILFSDAAWNTLANNAEVKDLVSFNDAKALTFDLLAKLLYFTPGNADVPQMMRCTVPVAAGNVRPGPGVPFTGSNALGNDVWVTYVDDGQLVGDMCGMRQLQLNDECPVDGVVTTRDDSAFTTWYNVRAHRAYAIPAPSCNVRLSIS